ncbi:MAG: NAD-dependent epimerase/dehydratase family protein [Bacteroidota bacterium]
MSRILVTGATGMVGSALTRRLVDEGHTVRIFRRASSSLDLLGDVQNTVEHALGEIASLADLDAAMDGVEQVYHTAGYVGFGGAKARARLHAVNVRGTANVVDAALKAGVQRMVHTSSVAALGRTGDPDKLTDETNIWTPSPHNSAYARSKYDAELEVQRGIAQGLDAVIVNPSLIFGRTRAGENTQKIAEDVRDGRIPAIPAGATAVVDALDVVDGLLRAMDAGQTGERYILASENLTWQQILSGFAHAFGTALPNRRLGLTGSMRLARVTEFIGWATRTRPLITRETARQASSVYRYSNDKARAHLGCTFRPFTETARRLAQALQAGPHPHAAAPR